MFLSAVHLGLTPKSEVIALSRYFQFVYLSWRGTTLLEQGNYEGALNKFQSSLDIARQLNGMPQETATAMTNVGVAEIKLGNWSSAIPNIQQAQTIYEKSIGADHQNTLRAIAALAEAYSSSNLLDQALALQKRVVEVQGRTLGEFHLELVSSLNNLAGTYVDLGENDKALPLLKRALNIVEKAEGKDTPSAFFVLNTLSTTYSNLGDAEQAELLQRRALSIAEKRFGSNHPITATALNNLGKSLIDARRYEEALQVGQRALSIAEKTQRKDSEEVAASLLGIGINYLLLHQYDKAELHIKKSLGIVEVSSSPNNLARANILMMLAIIDAHGSRYEVAKARLHKALANLVQELGIDHPRSAEPLYPLFAVYAKQGEKRLGVFFGKRSINKLQAERGRVANVNKDLLSLYSAGFEANYQNLASVLAEQNRFSEALRVLAMVKEGEYFDFVRGQPNVIPRFSEVQYDRKEQHALEGLEGVGRSLGTAGQKLREMESKLAENPSVQDQSQLLSLRSELAIARSNFESYLSDLDKDFPKETESLKSDVDALGNDRKLQTTLTTLGHGAVMLHYVIADDRIVILMTTPQRTFVRTVATDINDFDLKVNSYRRALRDPTSDPRPLARELYDLLVGPVAGDLVKSGAKTVMLSLDGNLRYLPFGALHDGHSYLATRWNFPIFSEGGKSRLLDTVTPRWTVAALGSTQAFGDLKALPSVKDELRSIVKLGGSGVLPGEVYMDAAFTSDRLKDVSERKFQLLHVASHFQFSPGTEINSFLLLGDGNKLSLGDIRTRNFRFDNVDLLTLSACETGLGGGRNQQGKEIEGFAVIAQQQGAKAVLATLWPVADQSTAILMTELYKLRQEKSLTKIEALRQAQLSLLANPKYAHPFYWAPFILMGNWK